MYYIFINNISFWPSGWWDSGITDRQITSREHGKYYIQILCLYKLKSYTNNVGTLVLKQLLSLCFIYCWYFAFCDYSYLTTKGVTKETWRGWKRSTETTGRNWRPRCKQKATVTALVMLSQNIDNWIILTNINIPKYKIQFVSIQGVRCNLFLNSIY